ncbi:hypothetical protein MSG28_001806 [Choristoneura fumiferana]|uniref:Uncharacterized protein n=1 Tax=Choristoneura fumiferana TaxID=7141 RepID=A0ACC0KW36_CHOFU|nr:hypothetical protein MSG28_001806 [Choristoneura fumiferana]
MSRRIALVFLLIFTLEIHITSPYKTLDQLKQRYGEVENKKFTTTDVLVGKAMDFVFSNRTIMSLIANELWGVGSKAIDAIVEMETYIGRIILASSNDTPAPVKKDEMTVWYPNQALDVWSGKKSMINVITNDFFGVLNGVALNPQAEWRPQTKFDADRINKIVGGGVNDRESVKIVELGVARVRFGAGKAPSAAQMTFTVSSESSKTRLGSKKLDLTFKVSNNVYTQHRALRILNPSTDLTGNYTCVVSTYLAEDKGTKPMTIFVPETRFDMIQDRLEDGYLNIICAVEGVFPKPELIILAGNSRHEMLLEFGQIKTSTLDLTFKVSNNVYTQHRALRILNPSTDLTGNYTCVVSTYLAEDKGTKPMTIFVPETRFDMIQDRLEDGYLNIICAVEGVFPKPELIILAGNRYYEHSSLDIDYFYDSNIFNCNTNHMI